ncbi:MAG: hypothetical protein RJA76_86 [Bacteroidota bacterium]|jgi:hypothetical protein
MDTPNIYLHFWADGSEKISFQEILTWNLSAETLNTIRNELYSQLVSEKISEIFPNIDWTNARSFEKWEQFAETLLLHIQFPKNVWEKWLSILEEPYETRVEQMEEPEIRANDLDYSYLQNPFPEYVSPVVNENDLLTADVYFVQNEPEASIPEQDENNKPELLSQGEKKVFEAIQLNDAPLLKKVESQLVDKLSNSISLYQSIHFTKELFKGNNQRFQQFIQFVDEQANPTFWKEEIDQQFPELFEISESKALDELLFLIEKKFS